MYRTVTVLAALGVALGMSVAGCTANGDGSTSCHDFSGMSQDERGATVARMLKQRNGLNGSTSDVQSRVQTTLAFCTNAANQDTAISDAS